MPSLSPEVARRLAAYAASAGVVLALPAAEAQIVYHDYEPDRSPPEPPPNGSSSIYLDVNAESDHEYELAEWKRYDNNYECSEAGWRFVSMGNGGQILAKYNSYDLHARVHRLKYGSIIGPLSRYYSYWTSGALGGTLYGDDGGCIYPHGNFVNAEGYAGFRFDPGDGEYRYGWMRIRDVNASDVTVLSYAYESAPGVPIAAGARSDALLDGDVNQTSFPPTGGTLVYAFTVENTTGEPQPLDLWVDADGPVALTRRLGSGTLPAGATVTRMMRVPVPAGAPPGDYDVRFKLGDFASGRFITFERYTITKQAAAGANAHGTEPFAVAPVAGDFFTGPDAAATLPNAYALSVPVPNPTAGSATLMLEVAEPLHVTVKVYDALGREVALLHDGLLVAGEAHRLTFDSSDVPSGVYVVRAVGESFSDTRILTLTR